jgi:hypothetical protein
MTTVEASLTADAVILKTQTGLGTSDAIFLAGLRVPTVRSAKTGIQSTNSTSWTITLPGSGDILDNGPGAIEAGDLILINIARDGNAGSDAISGYTKIFDAGNNILIRGLAFAKVATGSEDGTTVSYTCPSENGSWRVEVIKQWGGSITNHVAVSAAATQSNTAPDPNPVTVPGGGGYWSYIRACTSVDNAGGVSGYPSGYTIYQSSLAGPATLGSAGTTSIGASSVNPGAFAIGSAVASVSWAIAVRGPGPELSADSIVLKSTPGTRTADSIVKRSSGGLSFTAEAYAEGLTGERIRPLYADAVIFKTQTATPPANAVVHVQTLAVTARGTAANNSSSTTYAFSPGSNFAAGSLAVLAIAYDPYGGANSDQGCGITDSLGNTWSTRLVIDNSPGIVVGNGVIVRVFTTDQSAGTLTTGTTVTANFNGVLTIAKVVAFWQVASTAGGQPVYSSSGGATGLSASPSVTSSTITFGQVIIGVVGHEYGEVPATSDTDTLNGSWSTRQNNNVGATTNGMSLVTQYKIQNAPSSTQTYNPTYTTSSDWAAGWISISDTVAVSGSLSADAVIQRTASGSATANAISLATQTASLSADAIVRSTGTGSATADAVALATGLGSATADAVVFATVPGSGKADAWIVVAGGPVEQSATADAVLHRQQSSSFTADAVATKVTTLAATLDAILGRTSQQTTAADAILHKEHLPTSTADAVLVKRITASLAVDATIAIARSGSWTANAYKILRRTVGIAAGAFITLPPSSTHSRSGSQHWGNDLDTVIVLGMALGVYTPGMTVHEVLVAIDTRIAMLEATDTPS